jgi:hypothetical protein
MGYKSGYAKARRKEDEQYRLWMGDYAASKDRFGENVTEAEALRQRTLADYDKLSDQDKVDFQRSQEAYMAAQYQALAARGLSDSSIANNAYAGNSRETAYGLNRIADERQRGRIGYDVGLTADLINLKQAGPTSPSTAMYQATVQNLQASMQYNLAKEEAAYARQGPNMSWSRFASGFTAPGAVENRALGILGWIGGPNLQGSDSYYNRNQGYAASGAQGGAPSSGMAGMFGPRGSTPYGTQTSAMTNGGAVTQATGSGQGATSGAVGGAVGQGGIPIF